MHTAALYKICDLGKGSLWMMPKPNTETMLQDVAYYQSQGITVVVSLLLDEEIETLKMQAEPQACATHGIEFLHFSVKDMSVPELSALKSFNHKLKCKLEEGEHIAIHCHGGRGRAGTVAITLMQEFGWTHQEATQTAQQGRQDENVPVCDSQRTFVANYMDS